MRPVVVLSAHCDDAPLSLGALMRARVRAGARVRVVTVFGNDPDSTAGPLGAWDRRAGFASPPAATRARRREEAAAMRVLGVESVILPLPDSSHRTELPEPALLAAAIAPHVADAAELLVPGFPLAHLDHRLLAGLDYDGITEARVRYYVEQPYAWWLRTNPVNRLAADHAPGTRRHLARKLRAVACYRSQIPLLGGWRLFAALAINDLLGAGEGFVPRPEVATVEDARRIRHRPRFPVHQRARVGAGVEERTRP